MIRLQDSKSQLRSLYLRWRPSRFSEVVGQESNVKILQTSILQSETSHAYLFAGPRGTGKTSVARILAKAVNCQDPQNGEPCNNCDNCRKIEKGNALDLVEIDGASNRGIDKIRELREEVNYSPAELKRKVYIIDEVHMLTTPAFNALLKTLEEPPKTVTFIFATTEPEKIPTTIISRCQVFGFKLIPQSLILERLKQVSESEDINISDGALEVIAKRARGSMRDALVLLEQVLPYGSDGKIDKQALVDLLGLASDSTTERFLNSLRNADPKEILNVIDHLTNRGRDLELFLDSLLEQLRNKITHEENVTRLDRTIKISRKLLDLSDELRQSSNKRITLEIGALELVSELRPEKDNEPAGVGTTEGSEDVGKNLDKPPDDPITKKSRTAPDPGTAESSIPDNHLDSPGEKQEHEKKEQETAGEKDSGIKGSSEWKNMIKKIEEDRISIAAFLEQTTPVIRNQDLLLEFGREFSFHKESLEERNNLSYLQETAKKFFEDVDKVRIIYKKESTENKKGKDLLEKKAELVKKHFGGTIIEEGRYN